MRLPFSISRVLALGLLSSASWVNAAGFALIEQSASGQGLSYAGAAASTEDASVMWFNPAGMTQIKGHQLILGAHVIMPSAKFNNEGSYLKNANGSKSPLYGADDDGAKTGYIPNLYWKGKVGDYDLGLGINVPFGSTVDYDQAWVGRYHAVRTETKTVNINPSIARKITEHLSVGMGLNAQHIEVNLSQKVDFGLTSTPQGNDGYADLQASGWAYGYNLGLLYDFESAGKLGLAFRSQMNHSASGSAKFTTPANVSSTAYNDTSISANVSLPASAAISYVFPANDKINVLADATWTGWSSFDELRIQFENPAKGDSVQPENWKDVMRYSLGMTYQMNDSLILRTGVALDETPIKDKYLRTPRIADSERTWLSVGAGYRLSKTLNLDVAYTRILGGNPKIEATDSDTQAHVLKGAFDVNIDIISAQLVWKY